ncbi:MAG: iron alcohol dehydrogenase [Phycisphaerae bacterium]|nr:MAG: iron alcohol dehydrogenase [Phycisphaerae bacterium]
MSESQINDTQMSCPELLAQSPVRVVAGAGALSQLGELARELGASRVLLVTDPGIEKAGHATRAMESLKGQGVDVVLFDGVHENPTTEHVAAGLELARRQSIEVIVGVGGGSTMDCAKGINLLLTNGGEIKDYHGEGKATERMLPMIVAPTTAGTGSEAQSFALISDPVTHAKIACGDRRDPREGGLRPHVAILDHELTRSQPSSVASASAIDAISHAVETAATNARTELSQRFSCEAWNRLNRSIEAALNDPNHDEARRDMLWGAHLAGAAIEQSMLGAAHACANPLTAKFGIVHGMAVGIMLPHVVRYNSGVQAEVYGSLGLDAESLADRITHFLGVANMPEGLSALGIGRADVESLAGLAATQWTGKFNPVPVDAEEFKHIYESALNSAH